MTLTEQIAVVRKEIARRKAGRQGWIDKGALTEVEANYQIEAMEYVLNSLNALLEFHRSFIAKNEKLFR